MSKMAVLDLVLSLGGRRRAEMLAVGGRKATYVEQSKVGAEKFCRGVVKGLETCTAADRGLSGSASQASFAACEAVWSRQRQKSPHSSDELLSVMRHPGKSCRFQQKW